MVIEPDGETLKSGNVPMLFRSEAIAQSAERATRMVNQAQRQVGRVRFVIELIG